MTVYTLDVDGPTLDVLYTALAHAGDPACKAYELIERRLGGGAFQRAFDRVHPQVARLGIPAPVQLREEIAAEGKYSTEIREEWRS
jgi:hypothetical protein